jgi:dihydropteroate synthase
MSGRKAGHIFGGGPHVMGVVNVTPDSFSDGGKYINPDKAIEHGIELTRQGAGILDIGGESTRPGAEVVDVAEEIRRVVPVIEGLKGKAPFISVDTRNAATMEAALKAGANAVNDISALSYDARSGDVVSEAKVPVFLMHSQGDPKTMQVNPQYNNVVDDVFKYLQQRINYCETRRIDENMLCIDPGIGFGKTVEQNILLIRNIKRFSTLKMPVLLGVSRKSMIAKISGGEPPDERIPGSLSAALWGLSQGVNVFRVHDVRETIQAFKVYNAISSAA